MVESVKQPKGADYSRRRFLKQGILGAAGVVGLAKMLPQAQGCMECLTEKLDGKFPIGKTRTVGNTVIPASLETIPQRQPYHPPKEGRMDPMKYLTTFDSGKVTRLADGRMQREYYVWAEDKELEVAEGIKFPAWTYNGFLPGPTLRASAGDRLLIHFENKAGKPHTMHFHGIHPANMDGVFEVVPKGKTFTYDFVAEPFGVFPYHCHMMPLRKHISRGLFGTLIVDPPSPRPPATEMIMVFSPRRQPRPMSRFPVPPLASWTTRFWLRRRTIRKREWCSTFLISRGKRTKFLAPTTENGRRFSHRSGPSVVKPTSFPTQFRTRDWNRAANPRTAWRMFC
jgi:FtsP/CotA-like multicopper oxidase with cupredoxin domain